MLPARNRMRRSTDFSLAVRKGVRVAQSDLVLHARHAGVSPDGMAQIGPVSYTHLTLPTIYSV